MELPVVAHLAQDVFKEELMDVEERVKEAVDTDLIVEAYWEVMDIARRMPDSDLRERLINVLEPELGNVMRRAV